MCFKFLNAEILTENTEFYSFEPGSNLDIWLTKTVNALSAPSVGGIYVL